MDTLNVIGLSTLPATIVVLISFIWKQAVIQKFQSENIKLKADLDSIVNENNVRFSQAYSIRTMAMRDLYKKLIQAEHNLKVYINPHRPSKNKLAELEVKFRESNSEFYDYFKENEILFDSDVCGLIEDIQMIFINSVIEMEDIDRSATVISKEDRVRNWEKYNEDFEKVIPEIKVKLKTSFRAELGIK